METPAEVLIVPQGKIIDFIDGKVRPDTPEEYVRQEIEKSLVSEYQYPREDIKVEFVIRMGTAKKRADLVMFPENVAHIQENAWAIIECKSEDVPSTNKKEGVEQLKSYMAACENVEFGMWTNSVERYCFRKVTENNKRLLVEVIDIPVKGRTLDDVEQPSFENLKVATSDALLFTFRRCHNYIAGNQGLQKPEAFWELLKIIFCKITDERAYELTFYATAKERLTLNGQLKVKARIDKLFAQVCKSYGNIFKTNDEIELEPRVLAYIVSQLQPYSLLDSDTDVKGKAYEEVVGSNLRGDRGEFFTPRNICKMAISMLDPNASLTVLDPACGTGGFLTMAMNHVLEKIRSAEQQKWRKPDAPNQNEQAELFRKTQEYALSRIVGIDLNPNLVKAAKMNMVMNNDGSGGLFQGNSLERPITWSQELRDRNLLGNIDIVFTNPPFGIKITVDDPRVLEQYDLAHVWDYADDTDQWIMRQPKQLQKSQPPEILFIERCIQFVKPGTGIVCIVLPDAILGAPGLGYVREWILQQTKVLASIDLHPDTFQPRNSTQTSILILQRKTQQQIEIETLSGNKQQYNVFMALANHIGHDKRGNRTYVRDEDGNIVFQSKKVRQKEIRDGEIVYREIETTEGAPDDNTLEIAKQFRKWLGY